MLKSLRPYLNIKSAIYFFALIAGWPCVFYLMGWLPNYQINYIVLLLFATMYVLTHGLGPIPNPTYKVLLVQCMGWGIMAIIHVDTSYFTRIFLLLIVFLILRIQYTDRQKNRFVKIYNSWLSLQVILGTVGILLVLSGILKPIYMFREMDMRMGYFFGLFTTNTYGAGFVRNAGFFDEPGALAFWGVYALLLNKLYVKNKIIEYILIIGLISTLSLAYFIQLAAYLVVFYRKQAGKLLLITILLSAAVYYITSSNDMMYNAIFGRVEYNTKTGTIEGDNRSDLFSNCWEIFKQNPIIGIGARALTSPEVAREYGFVGANFFTNWASDGLLGGIITYIPLIYIYMLGKKNKVFIGVSIILLLGFLQRPYDNTQLLYPLITYTLLLLEEHNTYKFMHTRNNEKIRGNLG